MNHNRVCLKITSDINLAKVEAVKVDVDLSGVCNRTAPSVTFAFRFFDETTLNHSAI